MEAHDETTVTPTRGATEPPDHARRTRLYIGAIVAVVLVGLLVAWVVANRGSVEVDWLVGSTDAALALVIFVAAALGWLLGLVTAAAIRRRTSR
jgi:uncharacterized integral membrane protein